MDPAYNVSRVDKPLSAEELSKLKARVSGDAANSIEALKLEYAGTHASAIEEWKYIFMKGFPR